ncbi:MAG: ATP-dependent Clp protease ATP-binding subunit [Puniceicoccales bacterium]|jgi:ATP-dependent Clp protease ATP-binding subunit ClpC|nr:ATP-dependent Clp protease ATP-binding subunit [Puniceicoccales bacterium]
MEPLNFTPRSQQILVLARQAADHMHNNYVGTEHLLIGLIELGQGIAVNVLRKLNVTLELVHEKIKELLKSQVQDLGVKFSSSSDNIPFTPRVKRVLILAANEARALQHPYIGTEHLLLGILREGEGIAAKVLLEFGVDIDRCRQGILEELDPNFASSNVAEPEELISDEQSPSEDEQRNRHSSQKLVALRSFGRDLTALAKEGALDPVIGRSKEIERAIQVLCRRTKNNPALIGEAGVGKTAIVEGLAQAIADENVPDVLIDKKIIALDLALMVAGTKYRGQFEERLKTVMDEIKRSKNIILFLDELHTIVGAGSSEGAMDASNILKPALSRGEIQCIGATTLAEYRKNIEKDAALERRFQSIHVEPPSPEDAVKILNGVKEKYEEFHNVKYPKDVIALAVQLSDRYITGRFLPDKAIDIIDESGSRAHINSMNRPPRIEKLSQRIENVCREKEKAIGEQKFEEAAKFRDEEKQLRGEHAKILEKWRNDKKAVCINISREDICKIVSDWTKIPLTRIEQTESERLLRIGEELRSAIIGQDDATEVIARALRRSRADLKDPKRPIGSFLFLGPTGVGKTHLAKVLAEKMFGNSDALVQVDMSEYMEKFAISRLIGSPPGYVGHEDGGQLTETIRRKPYSVVLFDEIEKAHPDVLQILLQVMEDGHLTDSVGRKVDFKNTILVMTSNVGAELLQRSVTMGFSPGEMTDFERAKEKVMAEAKSAFKPEFMNRLTDIVIFKQLGHDELLRIVDLEFEKIDQRMNAKKISITLNDAVREFLIKKGYDQKYGARPLRRALEKYVEDFLAEEFLRGGLQEGSTIQLGLGEDEKVCIESMEKVKEK